MFKDSTTIYDNSNPKIYVFDASNSTISGEIIADDPNFSSTYTESLSTMLFYFDGKFVSGGYDGSYNKGEGFINQSPFSDWSNNFAIPGPYYHSYRDTSYNGFKWIALDVTSRKGGTNEVDLSGVKINGENPSLGDFGDIYEAYILQNN